MYGHHPEVTFEAIELTCLVLAANWEDASRRVLSSYRDWLRAVRTSRDLLGANEKELEDGMRRLRNTGELD